MGDVDTGTPGRAEGAGALGGEAGRHAGGDVGDGDGAPVDEGRCPNGAGCAPIVGRGAPTFVDGRTKGAGIPP